MSAEKKLERILDVAVTEKLDDQLRLVKKLKKHLPFFGGTKRLAAALLYEYMGDISKLDFSIESALSRDTGKVYFEDIKDGRARLFINIGKNHRISTGDLIREIVKRSGIDGKQIGKIDIHATYSFFEVPEHLAELVYHSFDDAKIKGVPVVVEPAKRRKANEA